MTNKLYFQEGNIVKLTDKQFNNIVELLPFPQNLFYIKEIDKEKEVVKFSCTSRSFPLTDILPVKINGIEDKDVYYDSSDSIGLDSDESNIFICFSTKYKYYLDDLKNTYDGSKKAYSDIIRDMKLVYVHEIQNALPELQYDLKIHYYFKDFQHHKVIKSLGCLGSVMTISHYRDLMEIKPEIKELRPIYVSKDINESTQTASFTLMKGSGYVVLCPDVSLAGYFAFLLDSTIGKIFLSTAKDDKQIKVKTNISRIKNFPVYYNQEYITDSAVMQTLIEYVILYKKKKSKEESLDFILKFLSSLRDYIVMEIMFPEMFNKAGVSILRPWHNELVIMTERVDPNKCKVLELLDVLFEDILSSNNELIQNLNRLRLYITEFMNFANKKMTE